MGFLSDRFCVKKMVCLVFLQWMWVVPVLAGPDFSEIRYAPDSLFVDEDRPVLFETRLTAERMQHPERSVFVIEIDREKQRVKARWQMFDDGTYGDKQAQDGVFTRKIEFKEKRPSVLHFAVACESELKPDSDAIPQDLDPKQLLELQIKARPSFIEIMGQILRRF